jgi:hypothetical protein
MTPLTAIAQVGSTFNTGGISYKVLSQSGTTGTVTVADNTSYTGSALTIPATVTNGAITYDVVAISNSAFLNCTGITSLTLPASGLQSIGYNAFACTGIRGTLTIPSSVTSIGLFAFESCLISPRLPCLQPDR